MRRVPGIVVAVVAIAAGEAACGDGRVVAPDGPRAADAGRAPADAGASDAMPPRQDAGWPAEPEAGPTCDPAVTCASVGALCGVPSCGADGEPDPGGCARPIRALTAGVRPGRETDGESGAPAIADDGRRIAFVSAASNLVPGDTNRVRDVFLRDLEAGTTVRISATGDGAQADGPSLVASISADGTRVAFSGVATNLVPGDTNEAEDVFVRDLAEGWIRRASVAGDGAQGDADSYHPAISPCGRYLAFASEAGNLVPDDSNGAADVFVHDLATGATERASVATGGGQAAGGARDPSIGDGGRFVAFTSAAAGLVAGVGGGPHVYLRDRAEDTTTLVTVAAGGGPSTGWAEAPSVSRDGARVAFASRADDLVPEEAGDVGQVYVRSLAGGWTRRVTGAADRAAGDEYSFDPAISGDGRYVVFRSFAGNLVAGDNPGTETYRHDLVTGATEKVDVGWDGSVEDEETPFAWYAPWEAPAVTRDGRVVAFVSAATNLVPGDANVLVDVFVRDMDRGGTARASVAAADLDPTLPDGWPGRPAIAGARLAVGSAATNLVPADDNGVPDLFVYHLGGEAVERIDAAVGGVRGPWWIGGVALDAAGAVAAWTAGGFHAPVTRVGVADLVAGSVELADAPVAGGEPDGASWDVAISGNGRVVAFASGAGNLVPGDSNEAADVFVYDRETGELSRASVSDDGGQVEGRSWKPRLDHGGNVVAFESYATEWAGGGGWAQVIVRDRVAGRSMLASVAPGGSPGDGDSGNPAISADGLRVAFASTASDLTTGDDDGGLADLYVRDLASEITMRVEPGTAEEWVFFYQPALSADGTRLAFASEAPDAVAGDDNGLSDVFVHDLVTRVTRRVSVPAGGGEADGASWSPAIAPDGRRVAFVSDATNLVAGTDGSPAPRVYVAPVCP